MSVSPAAISFTKAWLTKVDMTLSLQDILGASSKEESIAAKGLNSPWGVGTQHAGMLWAFCGDTVVVLGGGC